MLTATYSLIAIAAEKEKAYRLLSRVRQYIQVTWKSVQSVEAKSLDSAFNRLVHVEHFFKHRKIELHLIPLLKSASRCAQSLIEELDAASHKVRVFLQQVRNDLADAYAVTDVKANRLCHSMMICCDTFAIRLEREEKELLPMAHRILTVEDWFNIATRFLSDDSSAVREAPYVSQRAPLQLKPDPRLFQQMS